MGYSSSHENCHAVTMIGTRSTTVYWSSARSLPVSPLRIFSLFLFSCYCNWLQLTSAISKGESTANGLPNVHPVRRVSVWLHSTVALNETVRQNAGFLERTLTLHDRLGLAVELQVCSNSAEYFYSLETSCLRAVRCESERPCLRCPPASRALWLQASVFTLCQNRLLKPWQVCAAVCTCGTVRVA